MYINNCCGDNNCNVKNLEASGPIHNVTKKTTNPTYNILLTYIRMLQFPANPRLPLQLLKI